MIVPEIDRDYRFTRCESLTARTLFGPICGMEESSPPTQLDPRGRGFRSRAAVEFVNSLIERHVARIGTEPVPLAYAYRRVLADSVVALTPVPHFARAAMDGFAVIAEQTFGADAHSPARFEVIGRSRPGQRFDGHLSAGQAVAIATGAPVPAGADAVVPVEYSELQGDTVEIRTTVTPGKHVGRVGEDVEAGQTMLEPGRVLRAQDLGLLSALGVGSIPVVRMPSIAVIVTGDELLAPGTPPAEFTIPDTNSPMLVALIGRDGGRPVVFGPLIDDPDKLKSLIVELAANPAFDAIFVSGGSSTGPEDHAPAIVREHGELLAHGVSLRPASPTGFGLIGGKPVLLLPGNPVSCLCAYDFFGGMIVRKLAGRASGLPYPVIRRCLSGKIVSALGRVDYVRVRFVGADEVEPIATSGASILSSTTIADGFVIVSADSEGEAAGTWLDVHQYEIP